MRIVFCGTPSFAVPTFQHLLAQSEFEVIGVITQPDRPRGRGQEISFSPVKEAALAANLPVHQPEKIRSPEAERLLQKLAPDCVVIIAYGQIIPARLLPVPKLGWINLHASRSEEHTSELQSLTNLVCRLLLEKKKNKTITRNERAREPPYAN